MSTGSVVTAETIPSILDNLEVICKDFGMQEETQANIVRALGADIGPPTLAEAGREGDDVLSRLGRIYIFLRNHEIRMNEHARSVSVVLALN